METRHLKKWEIALGMTLIAALVWSTVLGDTACGAWWGVMYPELTASAGAAETFSLRGAGVEIRFRLPEILRALFAR